MKKVFVTGSNGFIGKNLENYFKTVDSKIEFVPISRSDLNSSKLNLNCNTGDVVIHLAGKAHDLKRSTNADEYFQTNTKLTDKLFKAFLISNAETFIFLSSVKAAADSLDTILKEDHISNPQTEYGKSKLLAEKIISEDAKQSSKRVYILRPCMVHGPGNKGNLNLLFSIVKSGLPWPLGSFKNLRSFCSIENLCFVINDLVGENEIPNGVYQIADDVAISTNELIRIIAGVQNKKPRILFIPRFLIKMVAFFGDYLKLPLNSERLQKLTESYIVSNEKICKTISKKMPISSTDGLVKTIQSFVENAQ